MIVRNRFWWLPFGSVAEIGLPELPVERTEGPADG
jgi:hypothetical protein